MSAKGVDIDQKIFCKRLNLFYESFKTKRDLWGNATAVAVVAGGSSEELRYLKSLSLQLWLLGYELPDTLMVITKKEVHVVTSNKKAALLQTLTPPCKAEVGVDLIFHVKAKGDDGTQQVEEVLEVIRSTSEQPLLGHLSKEKHDGKFAAVWERCLKSSGLETVDVSAGIADCLACKDANETQHVKKAAFLCMSTMKSFSVPQIEGIIDDEKKVKHSKLSEKTEEVITDPQKIKVKLKQDNVDIAYPPIYQSGGEYDLKVSAQSNEKPLHYGVIICSLGARYSMYCANISRTFLVDPTQQQEQEYRAVLKAHSAAVKSLVEGAPMSAAIEAVIKTLQAEGQGHLVEHLTKTVGFGMGLEFRESHNALNAKNTTTVRPGMVFNVSVGVQDLKRPDAPDDKGKVYALLIADTVVVQPDGKEPECLTSGCSKEWKEVAYYVNDQDGDQESGAQVKFDGEVVKKTTLRSEDANFKELEEQRRKQKENQEELLRRINEETLRKLTSGDGGTAGGQLGGRKISEIETYRSVNELPSSSSLQVQVDHKHECILVPIYNVLVPFHIMTIKNAQNNQDGDKAYIRINFNFGTSYEPGVKFPKAIFLKELSFRTLDTRHAVKVVQEIKSLRSSVNQREKERVERASLVQQEKLVRAKGRVYALNDVWVRPTMGGKGRKTTGQLEAHTNGFRYTLPDDKLDIMYRNIRHAIFQPAENDLMTLVHFHLVNPIMVGKKKTKDVQFYTEVVDVGETLDYGRRNNYDPDEIEEEQRDRERRNRINKQFQNFAKRVHQDIWERDYADLDLEFEVPFRELGFQGIPARTRSMVTIYPTVNCLVELSESPFTVITIGDIQLISLERVGFNLRQFDLVVVFKDLTKEVFTINAIPSQSLDTIKEWLTSMDIKFYENKLNLQWKNILKSIMDDPEGFIESGGWSFLDQDKSDSEGGGGEDDEDDFDGDEEFQVSEEEEAEAESSESYSSDDESLVDSEEEEAGSEYSEQEEEDEGLSWEELEQEAREEDRRKADKEEFSDDENKFDNRKRKGAPARVQSRAPTRAPPAKRRR